MQKFKVNGQSVPKIEWKQTDGRTNRGDCITRRINAVSNKKFDIYYRDGLLWVTNWFLNVKNNILIVMFILRTMFTKEQAP